ncbi:MAG TPA: YccF domain-containing protein [Kiritimatiellia bacterium]|nr:YccF domain-containing protein [Kiritimatiellia bacterium]
MFLGLLLCCTVVGIPFGMAAFRIAGFAAFPFGRELVDAQLLGEKRICGTGLANVLWIILAGLWLAIAHVLAAISCFLAFILVFPVFFGFAHVKLAGVCFAPLGKRPVSREVAEEARMRGARAEINQRLRK